MGKVPLPLPPWPMSRDEVEAYYHFANRKPLIPLVETVQIVAIIAAVFFFGLVLCRF